MKSVTLFTLFIFTFMCGNFVYGVDYNDIIKSWNPAVNNTKNNINQAELIEKYIINYKSTIKSLEKKYDISGSSIIRENVSELDKMKRTLRSIQTPLVEKKDATEVIKSVVDGLKIINDNLRPYLKIKQREYENKVAELRKKYAWPANKISIQIDALIKSIATPMKQETKLTSNQKEILKHLIKLEDESEKLRNLWNRSFETTNEIKDYLREIIISVRSELQWIKGLI